VLMSAAKVDDGLLMWWPSGRGHHRMVGGDHAGAGPSPPWPSDSAALARQHRHHERGGSTADPTRWRPGG
jgi:hypothetical protein